MISFEKLTSSRLNQINALIKDEENKRDYRMDFMGFYNNKNKIIQYFYRRNMYLIRYDQNYIGYIWLEVPLANCTRVLDFFIQKEYIGILNENVLRRLGSMAISFEILEDSWNVKILEKLGAKRNSTSKLLKLNIDDMIVKKRVTEATVRQCIKGEDSYLRCALQNEIFNSKARVPLTVEDIILDEKQEYFIDELALFLLVDNREVGYGQIVYNRGVYTVVNFGLLEGFRNKGFGADLLLILIKLAKLKGIEEIYIRVDPKNTQAINLYKNIGFKDIGEYGTWYYYA